MDLFLGTSYRSVCLASLWRGCDNVRLENSQDLGTLQEAQVDKVQLASEGLIYDDEVGSASVLLVYL